MLRFVHNVWVAVYRFRAWYAQKMIRTAQDICPHPFLRMVMDDGYVIEMCTLCYAPVDIEDMGEDDIVNTSVWN